MADKKGSLKKDVLEEYRQKRDFARTPEPKPRRPAAKADAPIFVIHKHDASKLHYDFRLEVDGVLMSWVIPRGPSMNPSIKRLAIPVEDHPLEYAGFEGVIPEGEYGAGSVMVWDAGTYRNLKVYHDHEQPISEGARTGDINIWLNGQKVKGGFALIHIKSRTPGEAWLLVKMRDGEASDTEPVMRHTRSALTGRTLAEIREGKE
jgi:DNA ligase D-like protein (predicted 3'-phosphoesterase)